MVLLKCPQSEFPWRNVRAARAEIFDLRLSLPEPLLLLVLQSLNLQSEENQDLQNVTAKSIPFSNINLSHKPAMCF